MLIYVSMIVKVAILNMLFTIEYVLETNQYCAILKERVSYLRKQQKPLVLFELMPNKHPAITGQTCLPLRHAARQALYNWLAPL